MSEINKLKESYSIKKIDKETINFKILNNNILMSIVGPFNSNLMELERLTNTTIFFRGNSITIKGENHKIKLVSEAIKLQSVNITKIHNQVMISGYRNINSIKKLVFPSYAKVKR